MKQIQMLCPLSDVSPVLLFLLSPISCHSYCHDFYDATYTSLFFVYAGIDERSFPSMTQDRDRERGGDGGFDNIQQNYYQRGWGDHPDLHSHDGRSQASEHHGKMDPPPSASLPVL